MKIHGFDNYHFDKDFNVINSTTGKILKQHDAGRGYKSVVLYKEGKRIIKPLHRLICSTFKPVPNMNELTVDHIDGNKLNNNPDNLEFVTAKENVERYWKNKKNKKEVLEKVDVYFCNKREMKTYNNYLEAGKALKINRYEILRRLSVKNVKVFKDLTMIKYHDGKGFDTRLIDNALEESKRNKPIVMFNHLTGETKEFDNLATASCYLGRSPSTVSIKLQKDRCHIFNSGWEVKYKADKREWSKPTDLELKKITSGGVFLKPVRLYNPLTKEDYRFPTCKEASAFLKIKPNLFNYRISRNQDKPQKDGFIYTYE